MPRVSVIMSVYNEEDRVHRAIDSIFNQIYKDWELIIVDDASTDNTLKKIKNFIKKDNRVKIINNKKNIGLAASLNRAILLSKGEFIARMDADDISFNNRLKLQVNYLDKNKKVVVLGGGALYKKDSKFFKKVLMPENHNDILKWLLRSSPFIHSSVMMRKSFLQLTKGYDVSFTRGQDYDLWFRGKHLGKYYNFQFPVIEYKYKEKRSMRSIIDSFHVRQRNLNSMKKKIISMIWLFVSLIKRLFAILIDISKKNNIKFLK